MFLLALLWGCSTPETPEYYADAKEIIDARCATCHVDGGIGPFAMTTYDEVAFVAPVAEMAVAAGTMPPWMPDDACSSYQHSLALSDQERSILLDFFAAGSPEGDPADAPADPPVVAPFAADRVLQAPEPYTPVAQPDDYRCQIIDLSLDQPQYVTGINIEPGNSEIAHHAIAFVMSADQRDTMQAVDDAEEGPGYTCFGGPTGGGSVGMGGFASLGSWVPGQQVHPYPEGTGLLVQPGDFVVLQMHYNRGADTPAPDQTTVELQLADSVERGATSYPIVNPLWVLTPSTMRIPANEVTEHRATIGSEHPLATRTRDVLGIAADEQFVVHSANLHMHTLGQSASLKVIRADGSEECLLSIPDWDFNWQGSYTLSEPVVVGPEDSLEIACTWDNTEANQSVVEGQRQAPTDVFWGEGTGDEMCLGSLYVTPE